MVANDEVVQTNSVDTYNGGNGTRSFVFSIRFNSVPMDGVRYTLFYLGTPYNHPDTNFSGQGNGDEFRDESIISYLNGVISNNQKNENPYNNTGGDWNVGTINTTTDYVFVMQPGTYNTSYPITLLYGSNGSFTNAGTASSGIYNPQWGNSDITLGWSRTSSGGPPAPVTYRKAAWWLSSSLPSVANITALLAASNTINTPAASGHPSTKTDTDNGGHQIIMAPTYINYTFGVSSGFKRVLLYQAGAGTSPISGSGYYNASTGYPAIVTSNSAGITMISTADTNNFYQAMAVYGYMSTDWAPPPCFTAESNLLTPTGYKSAADIKTGDLLVTADGRKVPVKAYSTTVVGNEMTAPFLIPKNALGMGCPKADLRLSPWHAIQMNNGLWMKPQSFSELVPGSIQQYDIGKSVTYYHFEAPNFFKDNLVCDGTVVESFGGEQIADVKGRVYNYDAKLGGFTRISGKPAVAKKLLM